MTIGKTNKRGGAGIALILAAIAASLFFSCVKTRADGYHTIVFIDYTPELRESDVSLTYAVNTVIAYRIEALPDISVVPESDLDMYLPDTNINSLWNLDKTAAKKLARVSNADLIIIGRHTISPPGTIVSEFHVIYLALDETVRTTRITFKLPQGDIADFQKKSFERLASKLPISVPAAFWKKQPVIHSGKAFDWMGEGLRHIAAKRDEAGLTAFEKALASDPDSRDLHYYLGRYYASSQSNYERAVFHLSAVLKKVPDDAGAHYWLGFTYDLKADYPSAIKEFEKSKAIDPYSVETMHWLGILYEQSGNYSSAAANYREAVKLVPQRASFWYSLACALSVMGKSDEAISALQRTLELDRRSFYDTARKDTDLDSLRRIPAFIKLMESFKP